MQIIARGAGDELRIKYEVLCGNVTLTHFFDCLNFS